MNLGIYNTGQHFVLLKIEYFLFKIFFLTTAIGSFEIPLFPPL